MEADLQRLERAYANGKRPVALWTALVHCARWHEPLPQWVCMALDHAHLKNLDGHLKSFDRIFGKPNTKAQSKKLKLDYDKAMAIARLAEEAKANGVGRGEQWFVDAGKTIGVSKTRAKELLQFARETLLQRGGKELGPRKHPS